MRSRILSCFDNESNAIGVRIKILQIIEKITGRNLMKKTFVLVIVLLLTACAVPMSSSNHLVRTTSLEESLTHGQFLTDETVDQIIATGMETMTVDYDCFSFDSCKAQVVKIKKALPNIKIRIYVNPIELWQTKDVLKTRPAQNEIYTLLDTNENFGKYFLADTNGQRLVGWTSGSYTMLLMNMSDRGPRVNGKLWPEFLVDFVHQYVYLPNRGLIDGIELDNLNPYVSWMAKNIDLDQDGKPEDYWTTDFSWRQGFKIMISRIREKFPKGFIITGRGHHHRYASLVDGLTFETLFTQKNDENTLQGGWFARIDLWSRLTQKGDYYTLNELYMRKGTEAYDNYLRKVQYDYTPEQIIETSYAASLMGDGYFTLDGGASGHGMFEPVDLPKLGKALGPVQYPYKEIFDSFKSWEGLQGSFSQQGNWIILTPGEKIKLPVKDGYMIQFYYQIVQGQYCSCQVDFNYPGKELKDHKDFDSHRWPDGEYYAIAKGDGEAIWEYQGKGMAYITGLVVRDTNQGPKYFLRQYEKGTVLFNPEEKSQIVSLGDTTVELGPAQGRVLLAQ